MSYVIRECERKDLKQLVALCAAHAEYEQSDYSKEGKEEKLARALFGANPPLHCWVVEEGEALTGYVSYTFDYSTWDAGYFLHMDCLYLEPGCRSKGIGREIVQRLVAVAQEKGCVNIQWQTPVFNENAIRFYNRLGGGSKEKVRFTLPV